MKKRSMLILGMLAALLAFSVVLTGCPDTNKDDGTPPNPEWPAGFTYTTTDDDDNYPFGWWVNGSSNIAFVKSPAGSALLKYNSSNPNDYTPYGLKSKSGNVYTVQKVTLKTDGSVDAWLGSAWTFTAVLNSAGTTVTVSDSTQNNILPNGDYTKGSGGT